MMPCNMPCSDALLPPVPPLQPPNYSDGGVVVGGVVVGGVLATAHPSGQLLRRAVVLMAPLAPLQGADTQ